MGYFAGEFIDLTLSPLTFDEIDPIAGYLGLDLDILGLTNEDGILMLLTLKVDWFF